MTPFRIREMNRNFLKTVIELTDKILKKCFSSFIIRNLLLKAKRYITITSETGT